MHDRWDKIGRGREPRPRYEPIHRPVWQWSVTRKAARPDRTWVGGCMMVGTFISVIVLAIIGSPVWLMVTMAVGYMVGMFIRLSTVTRDY